MSASVDFAKEVEQDNFDPHNIIQQLAWMTTGCPTRGEKSDETFDPIKLHDSFEQAIRDLLVLYDKTVIKTETIETLCKEEEKHLNQQVHELQMRNKASQSSFQELDERINSVATKVVHLGDQLESINTPRTRAAEAQRLMNYFAEFLNTGPLISEVFTDPSQLNQSADVIQKLNLIAQELPAGKFDTAVKKIADKYDEIGRLLVGKFAIAQVRSDDRAQMKEIASILSNFKHYSECVNAFIEESQTPMDKWHDIFSNIVQLCTTNYAIMKQVFINPDQVLFKFILTIYHKKLREHLQLHLELKKPSLEEYLEILYDLYCKTMKLSDDLRGFNIGNDQNFLHKVTENIFQSYRQRYITDETNYLKDNFETILQNYYQSLNHQKKPIQSGPLYDLKKTIQASIRSPIVTENYGKEIFIAENTSLSLIRKAKVSLKRCKTLSSQIDLAENAGKIMDTILYYYYNEYIDYALEIGLQSITVGEIKEEPILYFFDVSRECNTSHHLFEKVFVKEITPLTINTPKHPEVIQKKQNVTNQMEKKLNLGIERCLSVIISWISYILKTEQKKTDFKLPEEQGKRSDDKKQTGDENRQIIEEESPLAQKALLARIGSQACIKITKYLNNQMAKIRECSDGKNVEAVLLELGIRFHRVIFEHLKQIQFTDGGAMLVIYDVNEYRKCVYNFKIPKLDDIFETLYGLCSLLIVQPGNLETVCQSDVHLANLDPTIVRSFIQLRPDQKTRLLSRK